MYAYINLYIYIHIPYLDLAVGNTSIMRVQPVSPRAANTFRRVGQVFGLLCALRLEFVEPHYSWARAQ